MGLREMRIKRNLAQRELAEMSGVNFRSLQDYEQGHKQLRSASGDILLRLATVLGCSAEELIQDDFVGAPLLPQNKIGAEEIRAQHFYCEKYKTGGRWICDDHSVATVFFYEGKQYSIPFSAIFDGPMLKWLKAAAVMQMESKIEEIAFAQTNREDF